MTPETFLQTIEQHRKELVSFSRTLVLGSDAEDLVQVTMLQLWTSRRFSCFEEDPTRAKFTTWLQACLRERAKQWRRDEFRRSGRDQMIAIACQEGMLLPLAYPGERRNPHQALSSDSDTFNSQELLPKKSDYKAAGFNAETFTETDPITMASHAFASQSGLKALQGNNASTIRPSVDCMEDMTLYDDPNWEWERENRQKYRDSLESSETVTGANSYRRWDPRLCIDVHWSLKALDLITREAIYLRCRDNLSERVAADEMRLTREQVRWQWVIVRRLLGERLKDYKPPLQLKRKPKRLYCL